MKTDVGLHHERRELELVSRGRAPLCRYSLLFTYSVLV
jgi:hypothetical protein